MLATKWTRIFQKVNSIAPKGAPIRTPDACEDKWDLFMGDYKKVFDYQKGSRNNTKYWSLDPAEHQQFNLLKHFNDSHPYEVIFSTTIYRPIVL